MNLVKTVAKMRYSYHANMLDVVNVLNQLKIYNDDRAEKRAKHHTMEFLDATRILKGYDSIEDMLDAMGD